MASTVPLTERSRTVGLVFSGFNVGHVLGLLAAAALTERFGWAVAFYLFGGLGLAWAGGCASGTPPAARKRPRRGGLASPSSLFSSAPRGGRAEVSISLRGMNGDGDLSQPDDANARRWFLMLRNLGADSPKSLEDSPGGLPDKEEARAILCTGGRGGDAGGGGGGQGVGRGGIGAGGGGGGTPWRAFIRSPSVLAVRRPLPRRLCHAPARDDPLADTAPAGTATRSSQCHTSDSPSLPLPSPVQGDGRALRRQLGQVHAPRLDARDVLAAVRGRSHRCELAVGEGPAG